MPWRYFSFFSVVWGQTTTGKKPSLLDIICSNILYKNIPVVILLCQVKWRPVVWGLGLQFLLGVMILRWSAGYHFFRFLGDQVKVFLDYTDAGSKFVFGEEGYLMHRMAFKVSEFARSSFLNFWAFQPLLNGSPPSLSCYLHICFMDKAETNTSPSLLSSCAKAKDKTDRKDMNHKKSLRFVAGISHCHLLQRSHQYFLLLGSDAVCGLQNCLDHAVQYGHNCNRITKCGNKHFYWNGKQTPKFRAIEAFPVFFFLWPTTLHWFFIFWVGAGVTLQFSWNARFDGHKSSALNLGTVHTGINLSEVDFLFCFGISPIHSQFWCQSNSTTCSFHFQNVASTPWERHEQKWRARPRIHESACACTCAFQTTTGWNIRNMFAKILFCTNHTGRVVHYSETISPQTDEIGAPRCYDRRLRNCGWILHCVTCRSWGKKYFCSGQQKKNERMFCYESSDQQLFLLSKETTFVIDRSFANAKLHPAWMWTQCCQENPLQKVLLKIFWN